MSSIDPVPSRVPSRRLRAIRHGTQKVLRGDEPPTHQIALRTRDILDSDAVANDALDLTLRLGEGMLSVGAPVADVTATTLRVAAAYGLTSCQVDITFTSIAVAVTRDDGDPMTGVRVARVRTADYSRLAALTDLASEIADGLALPDALERLDGIVHAPHPYRRSIATAALAGMAACVAGLLGGGLIAAIVAGATTAALDQMLRRLHRWALPAFFQHAAGATLATLVAFAIHVGQKYEYLPFEGERLRPAMVVATGIVVLLAGMATVGAAQDALSGFYLTAAARGFEVMLLSIGIVVGVGAILQIADATENGMNVDDVPTAHLPLGGQLLLAGGVAGCWALASYARLRAVPVVMAAGALAFGLFWIGEEFGAGPALASAIAAVVLGGFADLVGTRVGTPALVVSICGITPLLPGMTVYRALTRIVEGKSEAGLELMFQAMTIGLALAAGVALGAFLVQPWSSGYDRYDRRVRRRARGASRD